MILSHGGQFEIIPLTAVKKYKIYQNKDKKTIDEIKKELGCDLIQNAGFFVQKTFQPMNHLVIDGKVVSKSLGKTGVSVKDNKIEFSYDNQIGYPDHVSGYPWLVLNGKLQTSFPSDIAGATQRSVIGKTEDSLVLGSFTIPIKLKELPAIMKELGCVSAINLDGGGSVQRIWAMNEEETSRIVHNFFCVWLEDWYKIENELGIVQNLIPWSRANRPLRLNKMKYITVHETDNVSIGATAKSHAKYLCGDSAVKNQVSWHFSVDEDCIVQHIPENEDAWHAGDGAGDGNRNSIGIEICVNADGDFTKAVKRTEKLVAHLCKKHGIPVENVVQHNHWNGKNCPKNIRAGKPYSWSVFVENVKKEFDEKKEVVAENASVHDWAKDDWLFVKDLGILDGTRPTDSVSREELAVALARIIRYMKG